MAQTLEVRVYAVVGCCLAVACSQAPAETTAGAEGGGGAGASAGGGGGSAQAPLPPPCPAVAERLSKATLEPHLAELLDIAKRHGGNRAHGTQGYDASVRYVVDVLAAAGLTARVESHDVPEFRLAGPGVLEVTRPLHRSFRAAGKGAAGEYVTLAGSPSGDVTAELAAVAIELGRGNTSESGCAFGHFDDGAGKSLVAGKIALLQRGGCRFVDKLRNASAAGAVGALVFNQGDSVERLGLVAGGLDTSHPDTSVVIPAAFMTTAAALELLRLLDAGPVEVHLGADTAWHRERVDDVILDVPGARDDEVFMLGAHLDSVPEGPGINDNASGSVALLAIARELGGCSGARRLRFAWWGAEELGLLGSSAYLRALSDANTARVRGYVNLDMIAAPNHAYSLADGDGSKTGKRGPASSGELEAFFRQDFAAQKIPLLEGPFIQRSDDKPFYDAGIGVAMLSAGFDEIKTGPEVALFGGTAGARHDPCYHRPCDDLGNINFTALETITRSVARAVHHFAIEGRGLARR